MNHSIAAAILFMQASVAISANLFIQSALLSWSIGLMVFIGFITHLLLDELYSVDFMGRRIKRSFGTALKIIDSRYIVPSVAIIALNIGLWVVLPSPYVLISKILPL